MNTDYMVLAARLQASPLYRRLGNAKSVPSRMLMQKVYDVWVNRPDDSITITDTDCEKVTQDDIKAGVKDNTNGTLSINANLTRDAQTLLAVFNMDSKDNDIGIIDMRRMSPSLIDFDAALTELRRAGVLTLSASDRQTTTRPYICPISGETFHYAHRRNGM